VKLTNTTDYPDRFLRRMVSWCCRQLDLPVKHVRAARFRNRSDGLTSGHAYPGARRFCISLGRCYVWVGATTVTKTYPDRLKTGNTDDLVRVTAHELAHLMLAREGSRTRVSRRYHSVSTGGSEPQTRRHENYVIEAFKGRRGELLAEWGREAPQEGPSATPEATPAPAVPDYVRRRAAKAASYLERWKRRLKVAQTKVRKYRKQVAYYEKKGVTV
jgi:hypothetical protein